MVARADLEKRIDTPVESLSGVKRAEGSVDEIRAAGNGRNLEESYIALVGGTV